MPAVASGQESFRDQVSEFLRPLKDYPKVSISDKNGAYSLTCYEAAGEYDFVVSKPGDTSGGSKVLLRITSVLGRPVPLQIIVR